MIENKHPAVLWQGCPDGAVNCKLCNFKCNIGDGQLGRCRVRQNIDGSLYSLNYHTICATAIDPIEKKPLFHFQPGGRSFSVAAVGCNFQCDFCQNWQISQSPRLEDRLAGSYYPAEELVNIAKSNHCSSISYTYSEPTVFMELCNDCGRLAKQCGLSNIFVSNGFMTIEAIEFAGSWLDAINVDLKAFTDDFYEQYCKAKLDGVLDSLRYIAHHSDIWLEVTTLVVPGLNDSHWELSRIAEFIAGELGVGVPWHISRFHPSYNRTETEPTDTDTLKLAHDLGKAAGLRYVYLGNAPGLGYESTYCYQCGDLLIERVGFSVKQFNLLGGACPGCGAALDGRGLEPVKL